jgi:hypothetical protein
MSRDWWYVLRHDEIETRSEELRQKFSNYEGVDWLEELPVPVIFARLKKEFPGIVKSASETDDQRQLELSPTTIRIAPFLG